jgi:hypothetical protein
MPSPAWRPAGQDAHRTMGSIVRCPRSSTVVRFDKGTSPLAGSVEVTWAE